MTVYSKDMGITRAPVKGAPYRPARSPRVSVPPNYRGHAIVDGEERPLGVLEPPREEPPIPAADTPVPRFEGLPRVSQLGERSRRPAGYLPELPPPEADDPTASLHPPPQIPINFHPHPPDSTHSHDHPPDPTNSHSTPQNPILPRGFLSLGLEELLLLGLILFLLREGGDTPDRGDLDETVILLGLLLLLG